MILIITHEEDYTADYVVDKLNRLGISYLRYNTENLLFRNDIKIEIADTLKLKICSNDPINSVWFRRIKLPEFDDVDIHTQEYVYDEINSFYKNLWYLINARWLSHPESIYRAENKLLQLKEALNVGFQVPETLVSSNPEEITKFYYQHNGNIVIKPISNNQFMKGAEAKLIFTNKLKDSHIKNLRSYLPLPSVYQAYVEKDVEIRVTVVGNKVYSAYVDSQSSKNAKVDWRKEKQKFHPFSLPENISRKCLAIVKNLGLSFGAIDMIKNKKGDFVFLEINPNGQWAWIEIDTGLEISNAIVRFLAQSDHHD